MFSYVWYFNCRPTLFCMRSFECNYLLRCVLCRRLFCVMSSVKKTRYSGRSASSTGSRRTRRTGSSWRDWSTSITWPSRALIRWTSTPTSDWRSSVVCRRRQSTCWTTHRGRSICLWSTTRTRATSRLRGALRMTWWAWCRRRSKSSAGTLTTATTRSVVGGLCCRTGWRRGGVERVYVTRLTLGTGEPAWVGDRPASWLDGRVAAVVWRGSSNDCHKETARRLHPRQWHLQPLHRDKPTPDVHLLNRPHQPAHSRRRRRPLGQSVRTPSTQDELRWPRDDQRVYLVSTLSLTSLN